jgi:hypothetical protein
MNLTPTSADKLCGIVTPLGVMNAVGVAKFV